MAGKLVRGLLLFAMLLGLNACLAPAPIDDDGVNYDAARRNMVLWHNEVRADEGLPGLGVDPRLTQIAVDQAQWIAQQGVLTHQDRFGGDVRERADEVGYNWTVVGENLGVGEGGAAVFDAMLDSSSHRQNIFDSRYRDIGVGRIVTGPFGEEEWWVVVYGDR